MSAFSKKDFRKTANDQVRLWLILLNRFITERNPREKQMIIALGIVGVLFFDYWLLINPVLRTYMNSSSQSAHLEEELKGLKEDRKNKKFIEKNWMQAKENLAQSEKRFIASNEMPTFLENISKLALDSGVKVTSLQPIDNAYKNLKKEALNPYTSIPIRIGAIGGTHEIGKFLSKLETDATFIKVTNVKILSNPGDNHRHLLELDIEACHREATP